MSVKYHLSITGPNRELLGVQAEGEGDHIYSEFRAALEDTGLAKVFEALSTGVPTQAPTTIPQAVANVQASFGQAPALPAAAAPSCQHGTKQLVTGEKNGRQWRAWGCPAQRNDPSKCRLDFIRD